MKEKSLRVLLIEDNPGDAQLLSEALFDIPSTAFHLTHMNRLNKAAECVTKQSFDIVFLDLDLPDSRGLKTLECFRESAPHLPVIVLTGNDDEAIGFRAVQLGAADYLVKGCSDARLLTRAIYYSIERNRILAQLEEYDRLKSELLATASHELRTPLTIIQEFVSLVLDGVAGPINSEQTDCLSAAIRNCYRLTALLNDLLDMSKLNSTNVEIKPERTDLRSVLQECHEDFLPKCNAKTLCLELEMAAALPLVFCDADKIRQALVNLLGNAVKFTPAGGAVTLRAESQEAFVSFEVIDTGKGISREDQAAIFGAFTQIDREDGPGARGTGLGLAITKRIVELHHGEIRVASEMGKGSRFTILLPIYTDDASLVHLVTEQQRIAAEREEGPWSLVLLRLGRTEERDRPELLECLGALYAGSKSVFRPTDKGVLMEAAGLLAFVLRTDAQSSRAALRRLMSLPAAACLQPVIEFTVKELDRDRSPEECLRLARENFAAWE